VENRRFLLFSLDVGDGVLRPGFFGALASAGVASRQESHMEMHENGSVLAALDGGALVWRTGVRFEKLKRCRKALSKLPRLRAVL
jgi:hypothetical protein